MAKSIVTVQDLYHYGIENLMNAASTAPHSSLKGKILCSLFYEPSTRTRLSFESAMLRLGGNVIGTENALEFSSAIKGESLEDSIRVISGYADVIVLRHPQSDAAHRAADVSGCPVINAGCGTGEHPTQSLTDLYTIEQHIPNKNDGIKIAMVGDLAYGRTVHSLSKLIAMEYQNPTFYFISPPSLQMPQDVLDFISKYDVKYYLLDSLEGAIDNVDVVYQTRSQFERHEFSSDGYLDYALNYNYATRMKKGAIIMHPLPRTTELSTQIDSLPQAVYFKQAQNGVKVRMALLNAVLNDN